MRTLSRDDTPIHRSWLLLPAVSFRSAGAAPGRGLPEIDWLPVWLPADTNPNIYPILGATLRVIERHLASSGEAAPPRHFTEERLLAGS